MLRILFVSFLLISFAQAQESKPAKTSSSSSKEGKFAQVYINPIGAAFGLLDVGADFGLGDRFSIGPALAYMNIKNDVIFADVTYKGFGFGARATWQFNGKSIGTGWVLSAAYLHFPKVTASGKQNIFSSSSNEYTTDYAQSVGQLVFGYRWLWWGHMSLKVAGGARYGDAPEKVTMKDGNNTLTVDTKTTQRGINPGGEVMLGFAF